jgi:hypothetical protein
LETISERKEKNQQLQAAGDSNRDTDRVTGWVREIIAQRIAKPVFVKTKSKS